MAVILPPEIYKTLLPNKVTLKAPRLELQWNSESRIGRATGEPRRGPFHLGLSVFTYIFWLQPLMAEPSLLPVVTCNLIICSAVTGLGPVKGILMSSMAERGDRVRTGLLRWLRRQRLATKPYDLSSIFRTYGRGREQTPTGCPLT